MALVLNGTLRETRGKGFNRRLRQEGSLPAVMYRKGTNVSFSINPKELKKVLEEGGNNALIELNIQGDATNSHVVVLKDHQSSPIKEGWLHADFFEVDMKTLIKVNVPIRLIGHSPGEKMGGLVEHSQDSLEIRCLPNQIPDSFEVNMEEVLLDQVVHVSDLTIPEGVEVLDPPASPIVSVHEVKAAKEKVETEETEEEAKEGEAPKDAENK